MEERKSEEVEIWPHHYYFYSAAILFMWLSMFCLNHQKIVWTDDQCSPWLLISQSYIDIQLLPICDSPSLSMKMLLIIATVEWIWLLKYSIFHLPVVFSVDMFHHIEQSEQIDHHCIVGRKNCPQIVDERYLCSILISVIYFLFVRSVQESKFTLSIDSYRLLFQVLHISSVLCNWNWNLCTVQVCSINY